MIIWCIIGFLQDVFQPWVVSAGMRRLAGRMNWSLGLLISVLCDEKLPNVFSPPSCLFSLHLCLMAVICLLHMMLSASLDRNKLWLPLLNNVSHTNRLIQSRCSSTAPQPGVHSYSVYLYSCPRWGSVQVWTVSTVRPTQSHDSYQVMMCWFDKRSTGSDQLSQAVRNMTLILKSALKYKLQQF